MKVMNFALALLTMGLMAVGCSSDDGNRITKTYDIADFDALVVSHAFEVELMPSDMESVEVVVSAKLEKQLLVEKKGSTLHIGLKRNVPNWFGSYCLKAYVSCKTLASVSASGASDVEMKAAYDALGRDLTVKLSGASSFEGQVLNVNRLTISESGASELELEGNGNEIKWKASGASEADLADFPVKNFEGSVSGATEGELYVTETFSISASGASHIEVKGHPTVTKIDASGASSINFK